MRVSICSLVVSLVVLLAVALAYAGPPSKTAVTIKLACGTKVSNAFATVSLCTEPYPKLTVR